MQKPGEIPLHDSRFLILRNRHGALRMTKAHIAPLSLSYTFQGPQVPLVSPPPNSSSPSSSWNAHGEEKNGVINVGRWKEGKEINWDLSERLRRRWSDLRLMESRIRRKGVLTIQCEIWPWLGIRLVGKRNRLPPSLAVSSVPDPVLWVRWRWPRGASLPGSIFSDLIEEIGWQRQNVSDDKCMTRVWK